ncbi:phenoloxidase-activating enzyme-like [Arctopsyche grandis]|uniref:phenoloxidase-activating enzyme-like n=1 Tax=Arctopsyche grandis TaxID=121162 RepID=UPI00406D8CFB
MKTIFLYITCAMYWIIMHGASAQQSCNTPKNRSGSCVDVDTCPMIQSILSNSRRSRNDSILLRDSSCGYVNGKSRVCCESPSNSASNCTKRDETGICIRGSDLLPPRPNCGREARVYRVAQLVDGESEIDQFPWLAVIEYKHENSKDPKSYYMCSAALISSRYVLTVAQCFYSFNLRRKVPKNVVLGEYDFTTGKDCNANRKCNDGPLKISIEKIISHPNFNFGVMKNDIALVRMERDVEFTDYIRPICLPQMNILENFPESSTHFIISGWNLMINNVSKITATRKQHLQVPIKKRSDCQKIYSEIMFTLLDEHVCAGGELGKSPCKGDSGIPLISFRNDQYELIGILSFGPTHCGIQVPNLYTNVFSYIDWIRENIEK